MISKDELEVIKNTKEQNKRTAEQFNSEVRELSKMFDKYSGIGEPIRYSDGDRMIYVGYVCAINIGTKDNPKIITGWSSINKPTPDGEYDLYNHKIAKYLATKRAFSKMDSKNSHHEIIPKHIKTYLNNAFAERILKMYYSKIINNFLDKIVESVMSSCK